jgi:hypothetical protein
MVFEFGGLAQPFPGPPIMWVSQPFSAFFAERVGARLGKPKPEVARQRHFDKLLTNTRSGSV